MKKINNKGITLVALIITIVVLLILAVVAIGTLKDSDIIGYAKSAGEKYEDSKNNEMDSLLGYEDKIKEYITENENLDPNGWDIAYVQTAEGWSEKIVKGNELPEGTIVAKLYKTDKTTNIKNPQTGEILYEAVPAYKMIIEGSGEMKPLSYQEGENSYTAYAWQKDGMLDKFAIIHVTVGDGITTIGDYAFACKGMKSANLSSTITYIGQYAFAATDIENINLPNNLITIGSYSFASCSNLKNIDIPNSVTSIEQTAFYNCRLLTNVRLSENITIINSRTFDSCISLSSIIIPESVRVIDDYAFSNTALTSIILPENVVEIWDATFLYCDNLEKVKIYTTDTANFKTHNGFTNISDSAKIYVLDNYIKNELETNAEIIVLNSKEEMDAK